MAFTPTLTLPVSLRMQDGLSGCLQASGKIYNWRSNTTRHLPLCTSKLPPHPRFVSCTIVVVDAARERKLKLHLKTYVTRSAPLVHPATITTPNAPMSFTLPNNTMTLRSPTLHSAYDPGDRVAHAKLPPPYGSSRRTEVNSERCTHRTIRACLLLRMYDKMQSEP